MASTSSKPARKSRTKLRKPKFLSLRLELSPQSSDTTASAAAVMRRRDHHGRRDQKLPIQLNRLPLIKLETFPDDEEMRDDENVAADFLFNGDDSSATTLSGLLDGGIDAAAAEMASSPIDSVGSRDSVSNQLRDTIEYGDHRGHDPIASSLLLRGAMKGGSRNQGEDQRVEKWVSYSEVVDRKPQEDEVSSCGAATDERPRRLHRVAEKEAGMLLCLKLDYEQVLSSWSDKGSLFIHGGGGFPHEPPPQTVPDLSTESLTHRDSAVNMDELGNTVNLWAVPDDLKGDVNNNNLHDKGQGWFREREASVLRYKEKRQNRLFAKRIRYEVRKLNAEKRPRVKGRFVRRGCEDDEDQ